MLEMSDTVIDVAREFRAHVAGLKNVRAAFLTYAQNSNRVSLSTLLDDFDEDTERDLARIELNLERSFREFRFEFETIHLTGREPRDFIPDDALVVVGTPPSASVEL
jgi:hypothetical protein